MSEGPLLMVRWFSRSAMRMRLRDRIAALALLVLLPVVAASVVTLVSRAGQCLRDEAEADAQGLARAVTQATRHDMLEGNPGHLRNVLEGFSGDRGVKSLRVYDGEGHRRYPRNGKVEGSLGFAGGECTACHKDPRTFRRPGRRCVQWNGARLVVNHPLWNEPSCAAPLCHPAPEEKPLLGILRLETDVSEPLAKAAQLRRQGAIWGAVVLVAAALPLLIGFRILVERPLAECLRLVREVSRDNLKVRSRLRPANEWGVLLGSFDSMVSALYKARIALEALNRDLEGQVGQRTRDLERALDVAQESDRMKTEFLANLSHEFSTPIQGVIGYSQLLLDGIDGELGPAQREDVETILRNGRRLLDWVEDLLELARLDGKRRILCVDRVRVEDLAEEAAEAGRREARGKPLEISYSASPGCPLAFGEVAALRKVLLHVVENAARHTPEGCVRVVVEHPEDDWVTVRVEDTGPGIDPEVLKAALNGFASKDGGGGLAVGLSLVRRLIELHQGTFEIQSQPGRGTKIRIRIPVAPPGEADAAVA